MTYLGMPFGMWTLFAPSFRNQLTAVFGYGTNTTKAMMTKLMKWFCRMSGKSKFTEKDIAGMKATAALCRLDYTMSEAGGATDFVRQYTLASGGPYCDCGYKKKGFVKAGTEAGR